MPIYKRKHCKVKIQHSPFLPPISMLYHEEPEFLFSMRFLYTFPFPIIIMTLSSACYITIYPQAKFYIYQLTLDHNLSLPMTEVIHNYTINKHCYQNKILLSNITDFKDFILYDPTSLVYQHSALQHYIFCDVSRQGVCTFGGYFHQPSKMYWNYDMYLNVSHTLERYDKAVVGFCYHPQFGHVLQDMIGAIIAVPTEIIKGADIFIRSDENQIKQFMKILGFEPERVHALKEEWIFVRDLYVSVTAYGVSGLQVSFKEMHDIIYRNNNLTNIKPTVHIFINKNSMNWGYVKNMDELFNLSKKNYPQYEWIQISPNFVFNVSETMKLFARTKLFVSATGSCSFNMIFLHPNCGVLLIDSMYCYCSHSRYLVLLLCFATYQKRRP